MTLEETVSCTPHEPGGPPACRVEPGHCVPNVGLFRRPTRQDMLDFVRNGRRTLLTVEASCCTQCGVDPPTCNDA